ncbi:universal stress protein [Streptomyces sp. E11-3]|uniref:universal stress protein n=1 Tax=Streptomyces sp. E11-3 TaxID=3110112 RepID=UPI00397FE727
MRHDPHSTGTSSTRAQRTPGRATPRPRGRPVTVGVDGSRESLDAAQWAAREALRRGLPLRLLHAGEDPAPRSGPGGGADRSTALLDRAAITLSYAHPALEIVARRTLRPVAPALLSAAAESAELVLGSRVFTTSGGFLVGPVGAAVVARAECPVVLVRAGEHPADEHLLGSDREPSVRTPYRPVVLGLDPDHAGDELLEHAFDAAAIRRTSLQVLHTWSLPAHAGHAHAPTGHASAARDDAPTLENARAQALSAVLRPWCNKFPDVLVVEHLVYGWPRHQLVKAATRASLLVLGRRRGAVGRQLGRTTHSVLHHVTCPVAVVPYG